MKRKVIFGVLVAIILISGSLLFWQWQKNKTVTQMPPVVTPEVVTTSVEIPATPAEDWHLLPTESVSTTNLRIENLPADIFTQKFSWNQAQEVPNLGVFTAHSSDCGTSSDDFYPGCATYKESDQKYYQVASFDYNNESGQIVLTHYGPVGYGFDLREYYFALWQNKKYLLTKESEAPTSTDGLNKNVFIADLTTVLPTTTFPKEINISGKQIMHFKETGKISDFLMNDLDKDNNWQYLKPIKVAEFENQDVWDYGDYLVIFTGNIPDNRPAKYSIELPSSIKLDTGKILSTKNYYTDHLTRCGGRSGVDVVRDYTDADLIKVGQSNDGKIFYKLKNSDDGSEVKEMYKNFSGTQEASNLPSISFDKYLADNPILVMKDGFGRYIRFTSRKYYVQMAECGKPVIYLYPKQETKINVQVKPNGGLTKVDPFYPADGWNVDAKPDGELTNISDNQKYPYLFWEGKAFDMNIPTDGFVLKRENVKTEMPKILAKLGLNIRETSDFMDFWQSKLEERPYVFVTFVSQTDFDKVAPLNILPRPDKVIRVFMDYQPLDFPMITHPLKIETPVRTGFTVVEWGGRLHQ